MLTKSLPAVVALVLALFAPAPALAGEGEALAEACVRSIARTTARTVDHLHVQRDRAIVKIRELDEAGASDEAIVGVGERSKARLGAIGSEGASRIHELARACIHKLNQLGADPALVEAVRAAADRGLERLADATRRSAGAINHAVENATAG